MTETACRVCDKSVGRKKYVTVSTPAVAVAAAADAVEGDATNSFKTAVPANFNPRGNGKLCASSQLHLAALGQVRWCGSDSTCRNSSVRSDSVPNTKNWGDADDADADGETCSSRFNNCS